MRSYIRVFSSTTSSAKHKVQHLFMWTLVLCQSIHWHWQNGHILHCLSHLLLFLFCALFFFVYFVYSVPFSFIIISFFSSSLSNCHLHLSHFTYRCRLFCFINVFSTFDLPSRYAFSSATNEMLLKTVSHVRFVVAFQMSPMLINSLLELISSGSNNSIKMYMCQLLSGVFSHFHSVDFYGANVQMLGPIEIHRNKNGRNFLCTDNMTAK